MTESLLSIIFLIGFVSAIIANFVLSDILQKRLKKRLNIKILGYRKGNEKHYIHIAFSFMLDNEQYNGSADFNVYCLVTHKKTFFSEHPKAFNEFYRMTEEEKIYHIEKEIFNSIADITARLKQKRQNKIANKNWKEME